MLLQYKNTPWQFHKCFCIVNDELVQFWHKLREIIIGAVVVVRNTGWSSSVCRRGGEGVWAFVGYRGTVKKCRKNVESVKEIAEPSGHRRNGVFTSRTGCNCCCYCICLRQWFLTFLKVCGKSSFTKYWGTNYSKKSIFQHFFLTNICLSQGFSTFFRFVEQLESQPNILKNMTHHSYHFFYISWSTMFAT